MPQFPTGAIDVVTALGLRAVVEALEKVTEIAIDVEADAMHAFRARLCFVQVGTDADVFLLDTLVPEVKAEALSAAMSDPARTKFFHAAGGDLQYLADVGIRVQGLFDTHRAATLLGWPKVGLADLVQERLQIPLAKEHQQSDFSLRPMPPGMRDYIANDVRYLCEIGRQVRDECKRTDILEEVELDCQRLADEAAARPDVGADYRPKLPRGGLPAAQLALAHALVPVLHALRLQWAEDANVPLGRMLSNAAVSAIALKPPTNVKELQRCEGVRGAFVREHGDEVLKVVRELTEKARKGELASKADDKGNRDPNRKKREEALKAFRASKATERKVTPSVVLTNPLVELLSVTPPTDLGALRALPYFGEKRLRLYGEALLKLLAP